MIPVAEFGKAIQIEKNRGEWREKEEQRDSITKSLILSLTLNLVGMGRASPFLLGPLNQVTMLVIPPIVGTTVSWRPRP
jgi:hypothetical protein